MNLVLLSKVFRNRSQTRPIRQIPFWMRKSIPIFLLIALFVTVVGTFFAFKNESENNLETYQHSSAEKESNPEFTKSLGIDVSFKVHYVDLDKSILKMKVNALLSGDLYTPDSPYSGASLSVDGTTIPLNSTTYINSKDIELSFDEGDAALYPFDKWEVGFLMFASILNNHTTSLVPIDFDIKSVMQSNRFGIEVISNPEDLDTGSEIDTEALRYLYLIKFKVEQTTFVKGFSIFVVVLMWLITLLTASVSYQIFLYGRKASLGDVAVPSTLLFALPSVRLTMPGIPTDVGQYIDVLGFIWNIAILALCVIISFVGWMFRHKNEFGSFREEECAIKSEQSSVAPPFNSIQCNNSPRNANAAAFSGPPLSTVGSIQPRFVSSNNEAHHF
ncbi:uncharacterized protein VTP21DRAFT_8259 [Calcarisporiella thermophila]|uniref:uncharacterized protein n=1 Tax=Calcarisporiella thermophila TaxID=911321 RepID=UPI0037425230